MKTSKCPTRVHLVHQAIQFNAEFMLRHNITITTNIRLLSTLMMMVMISSAKTDIRNDVIVRPARILMLNGVKKDRNVQKSSVNENVSPLVKSSVSRDKSMSRNGKSTNVMMVNGNHITRSKNQKIVMDAKSQRPNVTGGSK